jgi:cardiolipin synthase
MPIVKAAASLLYEHLLEDGVQIFEYVKRPLHAKVAVVDDLWATVGSSNLDPLSLSLNLEANVVLRDPAFASDLGQRLQRLIAADCRRITSLRVPPRWRWWVDLRSTVVFHALRRFAGWAMWLPRHRPRLEPFIAPRPLTGQTAHEER